ncbi:MAG TPA: glycoside hydrolase 43 family protein [Opitutaceae bacterium]|nr:glycoside hydrolase 43 family protein [Opitutaceae bacterium]
MGLAARAQNGPWVPDLGNGTYKNPVLFADYSDPDAIRVGHDFYLVSSSFHCTPGLPILHSRDLVNWTIIGHALPEQVPADHFAAVRHGEGVWAPALRYRSGQFRIYYPDPDFGIYVVTASDPAGPWSAPALVLGGKGLIDPCPLWDDDGQVYLVHAWAKSRSGISNRLTVNRLSPDGLKAVDAGRVVIDAEKMPGWTTLEGPKFYKRGGFYYIFAPAGGVTGGYQAVFRSKDVYGPYESRIVLDQGKTTINGPHQGAWVETASGQDWFLHFQDRGPFGRDVHLEPMAWNPDGWPVIGEDPGHTGKGQPVLTHRKPDVGGVFPVATPQTSDEFDSPVLGLQWQWQANPRPEWASLIARPGYLRLFTTPVSFAGRHLAGYPELYDAPNLLLQKFPAPSFTVVTKLEFHREGSGECAGLVVMGYDYSWIGLQAAGTAGVRLVFAHSGRVLLPGMGGSAPLVLGVKSPRAMSAVAGPAVAAGTPVYLRVVVDTHASCHFSYSLDGSRFIEFGLAYQASVDRWIGAKVGLFAAAAPDGPDDQAAAPPGPGAYADFDWFRVTP